MSSDPNDPEPLTPGHFLTGGPIVAVPEPSYSNIPESHLSNWQRVSQMCESFWKRYSTEYLHSLQIRTKWKSSSENLKAGDIVLLVDENLPPIKWLLGVITATIFGTDGKVRVVEVRTKNGVFKRAISKVCKMPVS